MADAPKDFPLYNIVFSDTGEAMVQLAFCRLVYNKIYEKFLSRFLMIQTETKGRLFIIQSMVVV